MSFIQNKAKKIISKKGHDGNFFCRDPNYMTKKYWRDPSNASIKMTFRFTWVRIIGVLMWEFDRKFRRNQRICLIQIIFRITGVRITLALLYMVFSRKTLYHKIEKIHHRTLKIIYQSEESYENLLLESSSVSVHQRHLRLLVTEIYKSTTQINPEFMRPYFTYKQHSLWVKDTHREKAP